MNPQLEMLRNMMAGKATPETQALALKTNIYADEKNIGKYDGQMIQEMAHKMPLPDMSGVVPTTGFGGQPSNVSEESIMALMTGKKPAPRSQSPERQEFVVKELIAEQIREQPPVDDYWGVSTAAPKGFDAESDRESTTPLNTYDELRNRLAKRQQQQPHTTQTINEAKAAPKGDGTTLSDDELDERIEAIVFKVLAQVINDAVKRKMGL